MKERRSGPRPAGWSVSSLQPRLLPLSLLCLRFTECQIAAVLELARTLNCKGQKPSSKLLEPKRAFTGACQ